MTAEEEILAELERIQNRLDAIEDQLDTIKENTYGYIQIGYWASAEEDQ